MIIRDHAVAFGKSNGLVGIVTEPAYGPAETEHYGAPTRPPAVVLLNTGVTHRVGANRMSTTWSRRLAAAGHFVLRFDQSGIGDSERRQDNLTPLDAALADL